MSLYASDYLDDTYIIRVQLRTKKIWSTLNKLINKLTKPKRNRKKNISMFLKYFNKTITNDIWWIHK